MAWHAFHGFDVGVVFYFLIDVGVAILATGTQITRNLATQTPIPRKASHADANPGESRHVDVNPTERSHANVDLEERDTWSPTNAEVRECQKQDLHPQVFLD